MKSLWLSICVAAVAFLCCVPSSAGDGKTAPKPELLPRLTVLVLDSDGIAVAGAHVGIGGHFWQKRLRPAVADADGFMYGEHCVSDASGVAQFNSPAGDLRNNLRQGCVIARQDERHLIAITDIDPETSLTEITMTLVPECLVSGKLLCAELAKRGRTTDWTNVYLSVGKKRTMWCVSEDGGDFHFFLPPGQYNFCGYGMYLQSSKQQTLVVGADKREMAIEVAVPAAGYALLRGLPAPELARHRRLEKRRAAQAGRPPREMCGARFLDRTLRSLCAATAVAPAVARSVRKAGARRRRRFRRRIRDSPGRRLDQEARSKPDGVA